MAITCSVVFTIERMAKQNVQAMLTLLEKINLHMRKMYTRTSKRPPILQIFLKLAQYKNFWGNLAQNAYDRARVDKPHCN